MTASSERRIKDYADERVRVILTTDGSCKPNPGSGGWGCILRYTNGGGREVTKGPQAVNGTPPITEWK